MITEEFTFPIISNNNNNNVVHLTVLPPLWRISSINQSDAQDQLEELENGRNNKRNVIFRSFSEVDGEIINKENNNVIEKSTEAEEKMDMLWEDFNEEASSDYSVENTSASHSRTDHTNNELDCKDEYCNDIIERPCRSDGKRKKQLEIVGKLIKKLFWLHNMARNRINKRGPSI